MTRAGGPEGTKRGRELIAALSRKGRDLGFDVRLEYPVQGGRIDVVWLWRSADDGGLGLGELPVVGFEVESSWRTRKHIKGDYLNLFDLGAALGAIVLLGSGIEVESTQRFAQVLVERPGPRIVIWTEQQAETLLGSVSKPSAPAKTPPARNAARMAGAQHAGKYRPLWDWLQRQTTSRVSVSFREIEEIIGMPLPRSSRRHPAHWSGYTGSAVARAIRDAGWRATEVSLKAETVVLVRIEPESR